MLLALVFLALGAALVHAHNAAAETAFVAPALFVATWFIAYFALGPSTQGAWAWVPATVVATLAIGVQLGAHQLWTARLT